MSPAPGVIFPRRILKLYETPATVPELLAGDPTAPGSRVLLPLPMRLHLNWPPVAYMLLSSDAGEVAEWLKAADC
ncbi:MAG: hypothetical protein D6800_06915 [Candidatus Zixiibacteriota bacterium]|nr:MAG: hypothetical protein D6800_06915 [candidate division Zixibacteria bacterium]